MVPGSASFQVFAAELSPTVLIVFYVLATTAKSDVLATFSTGPTLPASYHAGGLPHQCLKSRHIAFSTVAASCSWPRRLG